jgi:hypothetical protein
LFFAAGAGAVIFMILQLAPLLKANGVGYAALFGFIAGFLLVYVGTLIHYTGFFY